MKHFCTHVERQARDFTHQLFHVKHCAAVKESHENRSAAVSLVQYIIVAMGKELGKIIIAPDVNVWKHEIQTARALAECGLNVEFIRRSEEKRMTSADVLINGEQWEMKSPLSGKANVVDKTIRRALHQSRCVVFDSRRMKGLSDAVIERELRKSALSLRSLRHLLYVNRQGEVIDIK